MNAAVLLMALSPLVHLTAADDPEPRSFQQQDILSGLHESWSAAGQFLGIDASLGAGSLASAAFSPEATDKQDTPSSSMFHGFFKLLGFDTSKLNAIAVNAVVFIAKMIGSSLIKNFTTPNNNGRNLDDENLPEGSPLTWVLDDVQNKARSLLVSAQDPELPDYLMSALQSAPAHTDCIQLLVCRAAPVISGMQRSLGALLSSAPDTDTLSPLQRMYRHLPSRQELRDSATTCSRRIPSCAQLFSGLDV